MTVRKIIDTMLANSQDAMTGLVASPFYQVYDPEGNWTWACDVDIGQDMPVVDATGRVVKTTVLQGVPVASNNREIIYAQEGKGVALARSASGAWTITGLAKIRNSDRHYIYVSFTDDIVSIVRDEVKGLRVRRLTYGELADYGGYGLLPYGCYGQFDAAGTFIKIVGWP